MTMYMNKRLWVVLAAAVVLIVLGVFFVRSRTALAPTASVMPSASASAYSNGVAVSAGSVSGQAATVLTITPRPGISAPSLAGQISISRTLSADVQTILKNKEAEVIAALKKDPTDMNLWLSLAIDRKIAGDYAGAAEIWEYVAKTAPTGSRYIAYGNLGDVYMNFLKDYPKAESNYKQAIALSPNSIDYYRNLYTLYRYAYKTGTSAAADILAQGLKANPGNPDLLELQKELTR